MIIKPVKQANQPNYPTFEYYIEHPELLYKSIPDSWMKNKYVAVSLAIFVFLGCKRYNKSDVIDSNPTVGIVDNINSNEKKQSVTSKKETVKVAPVFVHGKGTGATGCIVFAPPVFISENEARTIIFGALGEKGIIFDTIDCPVIKFSAPPIANSCFSDEGHNKAPDAKIELKMDGYNKELNFAIQFVSEDDFEKFESNDGCSSSVQAYDTKKAAEIIRERLITSGKTNAVVFYDPISSIDFSDATVENWIEKKKETKVEARKLLINQVEDFIKWLVQEKIIEE